MDAAARCGRYSLLVRDGRIVDITSSAHSLSSLYPGATVIDASGSIVAPGFVNAHHHGESILLREATDGLPSALWDDQRELAAARAKLLEPASAHSVAALYNAAALLHMRGGTTTVGEFPAPYNPPVLGEALGALTGAGLRVVVALQTWEQVAALRGETAQRCSIAAGPADGFTVYSLDSLVRLSAETGFPIAAQIGEEQREVEALRARFKKSPLRVLRDAGALLPSSHVVHGNHLPAKDIENLKELEIPLTLTLRSALARQTGYPLLRHLRTQSAPLSVGTDWGETDMLGEMRALRALPGFIPGTPAWTPLELMRMATVNGARALGVEPHCGSLEVGKFADLFMVPLEAFPRPLPGEDASAADVAAMLVDGGESVRITDVMTQGVFRMRHGEPARSHTGDILREFRRLYGIFFPGKRAPVEASQKPRVPLLPAERNGAPPAPPGAEPARTPEGEAHQPATPGASAQKFPVATRKIGKVFGEDDL
ncbi:MAG TPA: amidohydrolase family protein [Bacteroidota bacterium]|nr:amidohydrolase family protein [Bacteroidota bacterium]